MKFLEKTKMQEITIRIYSDIDLEDQKMQEGLYRLINGYTSEIDPAYFLEVDILNAKEA